MTANLTADAGTDQMADGLRQASDELEAISLANSTISDQFEGHGWSGLDKLGTAKANIDAVREKLAVVADLIGIGGAVVRDARQSTTMATRADGASLGRQ